MKKKYFIILLLIFINCKKESWIHGKWIVYKSDYLPFEHISYCENLNVNSIFEFKSDNILKVYTNANDTENCNQKQTYKLYENKINILEDDMLFDYEIIKKSKDTLIIKPLHLPNSMWNRAKSKNEMDSLAKYHFKIYLKKQ